MAEQPTVAEEPLYLTQGADHESHVYLESRKISVAAVVPGATTTIQTDGAHGLNSNDWINIRGHTLPNNAPSGLNNTHQVTVTSVSEFTITYATALAGSGATVYVPLDIAGFVFTDQIRKRPPSQADLPIGLATTIAGASDVYFTSDPRLEVGDCLSIPAAGLNADVAQIFEPADSKYTFGVIVEGNSTASKTDTSAYRRSSVVAEFSFETIPTAGKVIRRLEDAIVSTIAVSGAVDYEVYYHDLFYNQGGSKGRLTTGAVYVWPRFTVS